jgi:NAD(P)-dependent dehydrogenase (short-subunit alcohol dehydrogenase family)
MFAIGCLVSSAALRIGVVGAHGGLGRELVQQSLLRGHTPIAFARRRDPILSPVRRGWLSPEGGEDETPMNVTCVSADVDPLPDVDAIVFAVSGRPFEADTSTSTVWHVCSHLPETCRAVTLVSAWGVGESINESNAGIRAMRGFYLRSTYASKEEQERLVSSLEGVEVRILRPKVLSYSVIPLNTIATPRRTLAKRILDELEE